MTLLTAQEVEQLQNSTPTDWTKFNQQLAERSDWNMNRFAEDNRLHVRFYMKPRLNEHKSAEANRAIYEDTEYVEIMIPGDKHNIVQRPVWEQDIHRFPVHYDKFKKGLAQVVGTPLKAVPFLTEAQVEEYAFFNIRTVEQLAEANDGIIQRFMGGLEMKTRAKAWIDKERSGETLQNRISAQDEEIALLKTQLAQLLAAKEAKEE